MQISRPDKILFPDAQITKADLAAYFKRVADLMLPHVAGRPLTLHRFPDGIGEPGFYQKDTPDYFPEWIERAEVSKKSGGHITHVVADGTATLQYLADQASIALHPWLARREKPDHPDRMIFDLDPPGRDFAPVIAAARALRKQLRANKLDSFVMTTGSSGLHVTVPLKPDYGFDEVREFAAHIANEVAARHPEDFTVEQRKNKRNGRVYLDVQRNAYAQTAVAPYSPRALPGAPVATPLAWRELGKKALGPRSYHLGNIFRRLSQRDCPWKELLNKSQSLPERQAPVASR